MTALQVFVDRSLVGVLRERENAGLRFDYAETWREDPRGFEISRSLPMRAHAFEQEADRFFGNLLPEGGLRATVCRRLGISEDNDFALLRAIGRECAGALRIVEEGEADPMRTSYRPLPDDELDRWVTMGAYGAAVGEELRLSLAGAQDKLGVRVRDGALELPQGGAPSTHLLKLPNRDFAALPENEALVLELARRVGLPVVDSRLWTRTRAPLLLVARFDRVVADPVRRLHQEDFCQALGFDRRRKYEGEGGPSFARCLDLVREASVAPLPDTRTLLRWLAFCAVVGNRDNHGKNLSLLRDDAGHWRLAPFYDLVSTTAYPRLSRRLALSIGGRTDAGNLPAAAWREEAAAVGVKPKYLLELAEGTASEIERHLPDAADAIAQQLGRDDTLVAVRQSITKGIRSTRRGLSRAG